MHMSTLTSMSGVIIEDQRITLHRFHDTEPARARNQPRPAYHLLRSSHVNEVEGKGRDWKPLVRPLFLIKSLPLDPYSPATAHRRWKARQSLL
jgi:hypothetical protein